MAICYDSPGTREAIDALKYKDNRENITIYVTSPNVVNTANTQYGFVRQIANYRYTNNDYSNSANQKNIQPISIDLKNLIANITILDNLTLLKENIQRTHDRCILAQDLQQQDTNTSFFRFYPIEKWPTASNTLNYDPQKDSLSFQVFERIMQPIKTILVENMGFDDSLNTLDHRIINGEIIHTNKDTLQDPDVPAQLAGIVIYTLKTLLQIAPHQKLETSEETTRPKPPASPLINHSMFRYKNAHQNPETKTQGTIPTQNIAHFKP